MTEAEDRPSFEYLEPIERTPAHLSRKDIVARCIEPGLTREMIEPYVKKFTAAGFLRPVGVDANDGRAPYLYGPDSALIAKCLHALTMTSMDVVFEDGPYGIGRAVSLTMKAFALEDHFPNGVPKGENLQTYFRAFGPSPAFWVILDHARGVGGWSLHVGWTVDSSGKKKVGAKLWNVERGFMPTMWPGESEPLVPHLETVMSLDRVLPMICRDTKGMN